MSVLFLLTLFLFAPVLALVTAGFTLIVIHAVRVAFRALVAAVGRAGGVRTVAR